MNEELVTSLYLALAPTAVVQLGEHGDEYPSDIDIENMCFLSRSELWSPLSFSGQTVHAQLLGLCFHASWPLADSMDKVWHKCLSEKGRRAVLMDVFGVILNCVIRQMCIFPAQTLESYIVDNWNLVIRHGSLIMCPKFNIKMMSLQTVNAIAPPNRRISCVELGPRELLVETQLKSHDGKVKVLELLLKLSRRWQTPFRTNCRRVLNRAADKESFFEKLNRLRCSGTPQAMAMRFDFPHP
jgi:hypothetical protein